MQMQSNLSFNHFKIIFFVFLAICLSGSVSLSRVQGAEIVDRIVAEVNDDIITLSELNEMMNPYVARAMATGYSGNQKEILFKIRQEMLAGLIDKKLTEQQINRLKLTVTENEINETIEQIKKTNFFTDENLRQKLKAEGMSFEAYRNGVKEQILRTKLVNREVKSKIVVTKEDVKAYYVSHPDEFTGDQRYHLRNILLKVDPEASEAAKKEIRNKIEEVLDKLNKNQPFELMAKIYSESAMGSDGGDLGFFDFEDFSPRLQDIFKGMQAGEISPVVDTDQGYQIFFIEEIVKTPDKTFEEASTEIQDKIYKEKVDETFNAWLEKLHQQSHIKIIN